MFSQKDRKNSNVFLIRCSSASIAYNRREFDETVTGYVTGINGNLANVSFNGSVHKNEVGYILVDGKRLKGEVIRINNGVASMQIHEMSNGIKVGRSGRSLLVN